MTFNKQLQEYILHKIQKKRLEKEIVDKERLLQNPAYWVEYITKLYGPFPVSSFVYGEDPAIINFAEKIVSDKNNQYDTLYDFYEDIQPVFKNKAFKELIKMLMAQQIHFIAHSSSVDMELYSKATLNGFMKIERVLEDIEAQESAFKDSKKPIRLSDEERFAVMGE